jgi:hypothetical protein
MQESTARDGCSATLCRQGVGRCVTCAIVLRFLGHPISSVCAVGRTQRCFLASVRYHHNEPSSYHVLTVMAMSLNCSGPAKCTASRSGRGLIGEWLVGRGIGVSLCHQVSIMQESPSLVQASKTITLVESSIQQATQRYIVHLGNRGLATWPILWPFSGWGSYRGWSCQRDTSQRLRAAHMPPATMSMPPTRCAAPRDSPRKRVPSRAPYRGRVL